MKRKLTEGDMLLRLRERYSLPAWALFPQVRDRAGFGAARTADALAMSLWPSRGLELHGFEIKVRRDDWLKELRDPAKAEPVCAFCDRWWLVATAECVGPEDVIPDAWGVLVPHGNGLREAKRAEKQDAKPMDRSFLSALLRRAAEFQPSVLERTAEYERGIEAGLKRAELGFERAQDEIRRLEERIRSFEEASGVRIGTWNVGKIGEAVKRVMDNRASSGQRFRDEAARMHRAARCLTEAARELAP